MLEIFHVETPIFFSFTPPYTPWGRLGARARLAELISGRGERTDVRRIFSNHRGRLVAAVYGTLPIFLEAVTFGCIKTIATGDFGALAHIY